MASVMPIRRGFMLILSSPSGAGKTTLSRMLLARDSNIAMSISVTTRPKRPNEQEGIDYRFVSQECFDRMKNSDQFLEHASVFGAQYGTPKEPIMEALATQKDVLFDIDWQGTQQLMQKAPDDVVSIFILPPSMKELERRLHHRAQDTTDTVLKRMSKAHNEISHWHEYDYVIINESIEESLIRVESVLRAERIKRQRQPGLYRFVRNLLDQ
jgi:guanylate kinase